jgi:hypothetical protein
LCIETQDMIDMSEKHLNLKTVACPNCNTKSLRKYGFSITIKGKKQRYQCKDCGHTFNGNAIAEKIIKDLNEPFEIKAKRIFVSEEDLAAVKEEAKAEAQAEADEAKYFNGDYKDEIAAEEEARTQEAEYEEELPANADPLEW